MEVAAECFGRSSDRYHLPGALTMILQKEIATIA